MKSLFRYRYRTGTGNKFKSPVSHEKEIIQMEKERKTKQNHKMQIKRNFFFRDRQLYIFKTNLIDTVRAPKTLIDT